MKWQTVAMLVIRLIAAGAMAGAPALASEYGRKSPRSALREVLPAKQTADLNSTANPAANCGENARCCRFKSVTGPCRFSFPADHGPHPCYRTEWWYYTGHLVDGQERRYGFQLTFFRRGFTAPGKRAEWPEPASAWRTDQIYLAHAALTDIDGKRHLQAEQMARPVHAMAGAAEEEETLTIWVHAWQAVIAPGSQRLRADTDDFALALNLTPMKPPVPHGNKGYSRKGQEPERASCYYSFTRLEAKGSLVVDGSQREVKGSAWMDHEYSTAPLQPGIVGWDWFSLQLSDRTEIMFFLLRQADGSVNPASAGTQVLPSGKTHPLKNDDVRIRPLAHWTSPHSGARYPVRWNFEIPALELTLTLTASLSDQEMRTRRTTRVTYWEGSVRAVGTHREKTVEGVGYVELTGYAAPFDAPM